MFHGHLIFSLFCFGTGVLASNEYQNDDSVLQGLLLGLGGDRALGIFNEIGIGERLGGSEEVLCARFRETYGGNQD